jgi:peptidoglycan/xylan/chitin deacetylase (PgdA/CDA1 family)
MYHDINPKDFYLFESQILNIKKDGWKFIDPKNLDKISKKNLRGKNVILTFDDGFYSNILLERNILKKFKIKAAYFIPTDFILMKKKSQCIKFIKTKLKLKNYSNLSLKRINMNVRDIIELDNKKHSIGNHTKSHIDFSKTTLLKKMKDEITEIRNKKLKKIIKKNSFFSYPFGRIQDISSKSLKIVLNNYKFIFLGIRGNNNNFSLKNKIIFRENISIHHNKMMYLSILNGYFDFLYLPKRKKIFNKIKNLY